MSKTPSNKGISSKRYFTIFLNMKGLGTEELEETRYMNKEERFDQQGNVVEEKELSETGEVKAHIENQYDDQQRIVEVKTLVDDHTSRSTFEYSDGLLVKELIHYDDGDFDTITHTYENDLLVRRELIDEDGEEELAEVSSYDEKGRLLSFTEYRYGEQVRRIAMEYEEMDKPVREKVYDDNDDLQMENVNTYNSSGDVIKSEVIHHADQESSEITEIKFSDDGSEKTTLTTGTDGDERQFVRQVYNEDGHTIKTEVRITMPGRVPQNLVREVEIETYN